VRERVFARGGVFVSPDLFRPASRQDVLQEVAAELGISLAQIDAWLFADRHAAYRLSHAGLEWTPEGLLARYNLELARGVLYWATHIRVEVASDYKDLWKFIKLFKLMFWAEPKPEGGYTIELDGPISPFVSSTLRYGRQLAAFLPAIFLCDQWRMQAYVHPPQARGEKIYQLDHTSALQSHFKRSGIFDSRLEADFASEFVQKVGDRRGNWRLTRESEVLLLGDTVMVPDFVLTDVRDETRRILIELVGFWHPQYLRRKIEKVRAANCANLLLLVYKGLNVTEEAFRDVASEVIFFQQKPVLKEVMASVESIAERVYGPPPQVIKQKSGRKKRKASLEGESDASSALE
jgi:predicted nuclease of restriction endonuclease-like RecB superfamily